MVLKRDGRREPFEHQKVVAGIQKACEKRPISANAVDEAVQRVERSVLDLAAKELPAERIGQEVLVELRALDPVAWLRFASVYMNFETIEEFRRALDEIDPDS